MPENAANRSASPAADQGTELTAQRWRVSPASAVFKGIGALAFALAALLFAADPIRVLVAGAAAALLAGYALRDLLGRVRRRDRRRLVERRLWLARPVPVVIGREVVRDADQPRP